MRLEQLHEISDATSISINVSSEASCKYKYKHIILKSCIYLSLKIQRNTLENSWKNCLCSWKITDFQDPVFQDLERTWCECDLCTFLEVFKLLVFWGLSVIISPEVAFLNFFFCRIMECNISMPSSRPSPVTAQVGCRCHWAVENSFFKPKADSILQTSKADGKSCLLARIKMGMLLLLAFLQIFSNSNLASSIRSSLVESTTKMMPSVQRV